jgi:hypothetical protein
VLPGGLAYELSEADGPVMAPAQASEWPEIELLVGGRENAERITLAGAGGRFAVVTALPEGRYEVVNDLTGQGLRVQWDLAALPYLWLWREVRASGGRWRHQAEILALEPGSVPHSLGLTRALAEGQAIELARGERFRSTIAATPFSAPGPHT